MSENAREDHRRFRQIASGYAKRLARNFPEDARQNWVVTCSRSFRAFVTKFPDPNSRDNVVRDIEEQDRKIKEILGTPESPKPPETVSEFLGIYPSPHAVAFPR
jgi:hypothetical protein